MGSSHSEDGSSDSDSNSARYKTQFFPSSTNRTLMSYNSDDYQLIKYNENNNLPHSKDDENGKLNRSSTPYDTTESSDRDISINKLESVIKYLGLDDSIEFDSPQLPSNEQRSTGNYQLMPSNEIFHPCNVVHQVTYKYVIEDIEKRYQELMEINMELKSKQLNLINKSNEQIVAVDSYFQHLSSLIDTRCHEVKKIVAALRDDEICGINRKITETENLAKETRAVLMAANKDCVNSEIIKTEECKNRLLQHLNSMEKVSQHCSKINSNDIIDLKVVLPDIKSTKGIIANMVCVNCRTLCGEKTIRDYTHPQTLLDKLNRQYTPREFVPNAPNSAFFEPTPRIPKSGNNGGNYFVFPEKGSAVVEIPSSPFLQTVSDGSSSEYLEKESYHLKKNFPFTKNAVSPSIIQPISKVDLSMPPPPLPQIYPKIDNGRPVPIPLMLPNTRRDVKQLSNKPKTRRYDQLNCVRFKIGGEGADAGKLCRPWGVCYDLSGEYLIVADRSNHRICIFNSKNGEYILSFGGHGTGDGKLDRPAGIVADKQNRLVVVDKDNHRIQVFSINGNYLYKFGKFGSGPGEFNHPWDVDVNVREEILISDTKNRRLQLFTANGILLKVIGDEYLPLQSVPELIFTGGKHSSKRHKEDGTEIIREDIYAKQTKSGVDRKYLFMNSPRGVCFTKSDTILMTDFNEHRLVEIFYKGSIVMVDERVYRNMDLDRPQGITVDSAQNILVCDGKNNRIKVYQKSGFGNSKTLQTVATFGIGKNDLKMERPSGIALNANNDVAVVDFGNHEVKIF